MSSSDFDVKKYPSFFKKLRLPEYSYHNDSFHDHLNEHTEDIVSIYGQSKDFNDIMPFIHKGKRRNFLYKRLVYKGIKYKSPIMKAIYNEIKKNESKNKIRLLKRKIEGVYKQSNLDLAKLKKKKWEKFKQLKSKDLNIKSIEANSGKYLIRSNSNFNINIASKTPKLNHNFSFNDSNYSINNNNNFNITNRLSKISTKNSNSKEVSTYYKSDINFGNLSINSFKSNSPKVNKAYYIVDKCLEEIDSGNEVADNMTKMEQDVTKNVKEKLIKINLLKQSNKLILDNIGFKKYQNLEKNTLNEIKRKINEKISDSYAFRNRKGFNNQLKNAESTNAYYIHLRDMDKTNEQLEQIRNIQREKIKKVEMLCEDEFQKKEFLKKRIDSFNKKYKKEKNEQIILADRFFLTSRKNNNFENNKINNGSIFPMLMKLREKCFEEITVGNFLKRKMK